MTSREPLRDYGSSRAVLIGTWDYAHLTPVPAAANSLQRMSGLLTGDLCGWPTDRVSILGNEYGPGDLADRLITLFEDALDVALFYFVGHGQIDVDNQLCLGLAGSRPEAGRQAATSLQFQSVRRAMLDSPAATKILILDCCFAGLASRPSNTLGSPNDLLDKTAGTGAYTMAASGAYEPAWFETDAGSPQTYFTKYMADLVEAGIPGQPAGLRLHPIFMQLRENLAVAHRPRPVDRSVDAARDFVFAYNAAPPETHVDKDLELQALKERVAEMELEAAARKAELDQLQEDARSAKIMSAEQQRLLAAALEEADRRTAVAASAQATAEAEYHEAALAAEEETEVQASPVLAETGEPAMPRDNQLHFPSAGREEDVLAIINDREGADGVEEDIGDDLGSAASTDVLPIPSTDHQVANAPEPADTEKPHGIGASEAKQQSRTSARQPVDPCGSDVAAAVGEPELDNPLTSGGRQDPIAAAGKPATTTATVVGESSGVPAINHPVTRGNLRRAELPAQKRAQRQARDESDIPSKHKNLANTLAAEPGSGNGTRRTSGYRRARYTPPRRLVIAVTVGGAVVVVGLVIAILTSGLPQILVGHIRWTHATGSAVDSSPAVTGGTVYIGNNDGKVYALDAATGHAIWTYTVAGGAAGSSPAVAEGTVCFGSGDGKVYALDATTGHIIWTYTVAGGAAGSSPAVAGGTLYIGSGDGKVYALDPTTGYVDWTHTTGDAADSSPAVASGIVYIGSGDGKVYALDATTGHVRWTHTTAGPVESSPAVAGGTVYIGSEEGNVYALTATVDGSH